MMSDQATPFIVPHCDEAVEILQQDESFLLVNKPNELLSVPGKHPDNRDCLISRLQQDFRTARIVHRLDMSTSGIMVVALTAASHRELSRQFELRQTDKHYIAWVDGLMQEEQGSITLPIITDWPNRPLQKVCYETGKKAQTDYVVLQRDSDKQQTRVLLKPITGRSHQLRIHLAEIGHPILGCRFYGSEASIAKSPRLLLHAEKLVFQHPETGEPVEGFSPCPF